MRGFPAALLLLIASSMVGTAALAQGGTVALTGRVSGPDGAPVRTATIRATQGPRTHSARTDEGGSYRLTGLATGTWTLSVRSVGHRPATETIELTTAGARRDFSLERAVPALDPVLVAAKWTGVRGQVVDARTNLPLDGADIAVMGSRGSRLSADEEGRFAVERREDSEVIVRVARPGFANRVVVTRVPEQGYAELEIALDTLRGRERQIESGDLDARLRQMSGEAGIIGREEIERLRATSLGQLLMDSPTAARKTLIVNRKACLFVNGMPRPGMPVDIVPTADIELIELYPPGSERSNTLAKRWPPRGQCGAPSYGYERGDADPKLVRYVSIWTRAR